MTTTQPLRVGVVGTGFAGGVAVKGFNALDGVEVVAIADPIPDRLAALQAEHNIPDTYADYADMVKRDDIDIISVATPNYLHAPVAIAAMQNGKHVLTEKPLSRTVAEAEAMVATAIQHDRVLRVVYSQRRHEDVETLKAYIDEGHLGRIYHAKASWMRRQGIPGMGGWFTTRELSGGGPLIDLGVHVLDMALTLMGEPEPVSVSGAVYAEHGYRGRGSRSVNNKTGGNGQYDVEDLATAFVRFAGGSTLHLEASWHVFGRQADDFGVVLYGTEGGAQIDIRRYNREGSLTIFTDVVGKPAEVQPVVKPGGGHFAVIEEFVEIVRSGEWDAYRGQEGLTRQRILEACYESAADGREVVL